MPTHTQVKSAKQKQVRPVSTGWQSAYNAKVMAGAEAIAHVVKNDDVIAIGGLTLSMGVIGPLFDSVRAGQLKGIRMVGNLATSPMPMDDPDLTAEQIFYQGFFCGPEERKAIAAGKGSFIPTQFGNYRRFMVDNLRPDVTILNVTPPDDNGYCNLGPFASGVGPDMIAGAKKVIGQVNRHLPRPYGHESINVHVSRFAALVEHDEKMVESLMPEPTELEKTIAGYILEHIPDGACIQLGIGGTANAVGYGLEHKKDLGVFTEMFTESMMYLHQLGVINNSKKSFMPGVSVSGFTNGSQALYDYVHMNKDLYFAPYSFTNDIANIAKNDNMISINNAMSIDLMGQACAETVGFRQYSGTGGQVDYVRGASRARGGKSFLAIPSTFTKNGETQSKIVLNFGPGNCVTTLRSDVQYVVTEYGLVNLFGEDLSTRAKRLISIAHPQFREQLTFDAKKHGLIV